MALDGSLAKTNTSVQKNTSKVFNNGDSKPGKLGGMIDSASGIQKNVAGTAVGLGNIVAKVGGGSKLTGKSKAKYKSVNESKFLGGLMGFYSHFGGGTEIESIDRIDPFSTFECEFKFFPSITGTQNVQKLRKDTVYNNGAGEKFVESSSDTEESKSTEINEDSVLAKILNEVKFKDSILEKDLEKGEKESFVESEAKEPTWSEDEEGVVFTKDIEYTVFTERQITDIAVNLGIYIQRVVIPNIQIEGGEDVTTLLGKFPVPGNLVIPDNNTFSMEIVNVEQPIIENVFYPWMRETTLPKWSYEGQPYTTARITIDFTEHANVVYYFYGCRPIQIQLIHPDQAQTSNLTRSVTFAFDFMTVQTTSTRTTLKDSDKKKKKGGKDKGGYGKTDMANAALFSAANTLKL